MVRYLKRKDIDIVKYDACIEAAINSRIYAYSWYLDIVASNWDALVLNEYEAVMPLPWRQKYFIKYIYPPAWTQQLGIFSTKKIDADLVKKFVNTIPKKFKKITIQFNSENHLNFFKVEKRMNYILPLNKLYEDIFNGFNKNRKRVLKSVSTLNLTINKNINALEFLDFYFNESKNYELRIDQITATKKLVNLTNNSVFIWGIKEQGNIIAGLIWLKDKNRITYLLPIATKAAKEKGLPTFLISNLIEEFQNTKLLLDFEGSMIKGVADFYKGFGAEEEVYSCFKKKLLF
ncbi:hypothetical protein [Flavobacterium sp.]|uniref:hypothetical protein n=1 Tax=Flavobacterium sp. TaxID=239 RepID=UPI0040484678